MYLSKISNTGAGAVAERENFGSATLAQLIYRTTCVELMIFS